MKKYSFFSHTADMGMEVRGTTLSELYAHAAEGLFSYLAVPVDGSAAVSRTVAVTGVDPESLMVNWLNELLYLGTSLNVSFATFTVTRLDSGHLEARVWGQRVAEGRRFGHEIKAVTYHGLNIVRTREGFQTRIIFDI